ncbi:hypothetical protein BOH66_06240 [Microbacterium aurum]|uniref:Ketoreductase domain-containing protein n=1 Tax=Microbacterium aurum TaxID=36805 RepID=A0A1P8U714_9MICO|nr:SDR family NAD(P)-dependent oxidoreductase [Microbacterium aurum]APZ33898.1 hypothetical protein BOH66_06240 [Microbacterium aurum]MBM7827659.1 NAD(P)-dependent dehydrogenase (short-subunit alcohol dehydrogenase family) [Microbacterium aurum]
MAVNKTGGSSAPVAVVTGGTRGIGLAIAEALVAEGMQVVTVGTSEPTTRPANMTFHRCDISAEDEVTALAAAVEHQYGSVDVLVNNASVSARAALAETTLEDWTRVLSVNLTGTFLMCRAFAGLLNEGGSIVNVASQAGKRGESHILAYATSKAGQLGLTKSLARELAPRIRVNAVCPAVVETDLMLQHYAALADLRRVDEEAIRAEYLAPIPLARPQSAEAIAQAVVFLSSDRASEITGQCLSVDGGLVME